METLELDCEAVRISERRRDDGVASAIQGLNPGAPARTVDRVGSASGLLAMCAAARAHVCDRRVRPRVPDDE